jgi:hypothetical protein
MAPDIILSATTGILSSKATLNAEITNVYGETITDRGFEWGEVSGNYEHSWSEAVDGAGAFNHQITSLNELETYYFRAWATSAGGTTYTGEGAFNTIANAYSINISGVSRAGDVLANTLGVEDVINDQVNTCAFSLIDLSGNGMPSTDQTVIITQEDGTVLFGGYITSIVKTKSETGLAMAEIECVDMSRLLDRQLAHKSYENMTDKAIIQDLVDTYCAGSGITTDNVVEGVTITQISFNYMQISQAIKKIAELAGRWWYIDDQKDIHYFPVSTTSTPFDITDTNASHIEMEISSDADNIKNRVYVRGGTKLSDFTTYETVGDGTAIKFPLPDKPHSVTVAVDTGAGYVTKTLGIKNIDTSGFDWYLNFQEKYIEQDSGGVVLTSTDKLKVTYKYDIPIIVAVENQASIIEHGVHEFAISDKSITTTQSARDRASAELTDYANTLVEGRFTTTTDGFHSGQTININLTDYGINDNYVVQRVNARSLGNGVFHYDIEVASAQTMGIIKFLIDLLEADRNLIEIDSDEVIDELYETSDALLSDSLLENLTIDSAGPYSTWCVDSLETTQTRAVWNLFQFG